MGALMQLVAVGTQDAYLTGTPTITFFQAVYQQTTNFAMENILQTVNGTPGSGNKVSVIIARNGDLVGNMELVLSPLQNSNLTSNSNVYDTNWIAERAIADVTLLIGGQQIDKHYQGWWRLYAELFLSHNDKLQYYKMTSSMVTTTGSGSSSTTPYRVHLPLLFFFNRNPGLFLPLVALQYHEVRLDFTTSTYFLNYFDTTFDVWATYVYLDTPERTQFAQNSMQYLIEQLQHSGGDTITSIGETSPNLIRLQFNHPIKELCWFYQNANPNSVGNLNAMWNFSTNHANVNVTIDPVVAFNSNSLSLPDVLGSPRVFSGNALVAGQPLTASFKSWTEEGKANTAVNGFETGSLHQFKILLNGQDRFKEQYGRYFNQVQPFYYHSGNPYPGIYNYSFALQPEELQPTGSLNASRIDNIQAYVSLKAGTTSTIQKLFAVNYNILNIQSGMGGLAFAS
jgi:Large eukaryotic DNA virus major capsid protein/Major capsid protein N-terminus